MYHHALLCCPSADDSQDLSAVLESFEIRVVSATSMSEALHLAGKRDFVLILVDLDRDAGWQSTLQRLKEHAPRAGLLAYSRLREERLWLDALDAGAFDFVCKPFRRVELHWVVENALKTKRAEAAAGAA